MADRESKTGTTIKDIKDGELYGVLLKARGEADCYTDENILRRLYAAEDFYEHFCGMRFRPTRVISNAKLRIGSNDPAVKVTDFDPTVDIEEPAYNYDVGLFNEQRWANIMLSFRPVIGVDKAFFWYPGTAIGSSWNIALDWMRMDRELGEFQLVPASGQLLPLLSLNTYVLGHVAQGRSIPNSLFIDYRVGFEDGELVHNHQDLLRGVQLLTALSLFGIASTARTGGVGSTSLSMDGLSRSQGFSGKYGAYSGQIELSLAQEKEVRENWRARFHGVEVAWA